MTRNSAFQRPRLFASAAFSAALGLSGLATLAVAGCSVTDIVEGDDQKDFPALPTDPTGPSTPGEPNGCDLTGKWFVHLHANVMALGLPTVSNNWFYLEIQDNGDDIVITRGWDCGFEVCGKLTKLDLNLAQTAMLALRNRQDGEVDATRNISVAPRTGTYKPAANGECTLELERWWWIRGADIATTLPERGAFATSSISDLKTSRPLPPKVGAPVDPSNNWDNDDYPGITLNLTLPNGIRAVGQRDWNEFGPGLVPDGATDFMIPALFDSEEVVFHAAPALLDQASAPTKDHTVRFIRLPDDINPPVDPNAFAAFCSEKVTELIRPELCNY